MTCLCVFYPFLSLLLYVYPKSSLLRSLRQGTSWGTIGNSSSPHFHLKFIGFTLYLLQTTSARFLTFAVTLHVLVYSSAFSICLCNPSGVSDTPTKSPAINPYTVSSPTATCCLAASTATIRSLIPGIYLE